MTLLRTCTLLNIEKISSSRSYSSLNLMVSNEKLLRTIHFSVRHPNRPLKGTGKALNGFHEDKSNQKEVPRLSLYRYGGWHVFASLVKTDGMTTIEQVKEATILDLIPPKIKDGKWRGLSFVCLQPWFGGRGWGGGAVPFYSVQDCSSI